MSEPFDDAAMSGAEFARRHGNGQADPDIQPYPFTRLQAIRPNLKANEIIKELLPRHAFGEVHADRSGGKTAILADLVLHVAAGLEYRSRRTHQQPVLYVALEGHGGIDNRIVAAREELGITGDVPFALIKISDNFRDPEPAIRLAATVKALAKDYPDSCPVVVIDTYTAALGASASDCDPKDVSAFISHIQRHLLSIGCTIVILHHFGKDKSKGGRGWTGLGAALDFEWDIDRDGELRTLRMRKVRDGSDQGPAPCYRFRGRLLGNNEYGEPVTAVVVEHLADEAADKPDQRHSPKARAALNVLWECIKDRARSFPMPDEPGLRCMLLSDWEAECIKPGVISRSQQEKDRRKQFRAAMEELVKASAAVCDGGRVFPAPKGPREVRE